MSEVATVEVKNVEAAVEIAGKKPIYYVVLSYVLLFFYSLCFGFRVFGRENIPASGGLLIASNHQSHLDPPFFGVVMPRVVHVMARESLFNIHPMFARLLRLCKGFPVKRDGLGLDAIRKCVDFLKSGEIVAMFPEGTRSPDGLIHEMHPGVIMAAQRAGVPILPVVIDGAYNAWPRQAKTFSCKQVKMIIGKPMDVQGLDRKEASKRLRETLLTLRAELNHGCQ